MIYLTCVWERRVRSGCGEGGINLCVRAVSLPMALLRPMKNERIKFYDIVWACHQLWTKAHTSCPPPSRTLTLPHPPSLSLSHSHAAPLTHGRQTSGKVQSQTITLSINKKPKAHTQKQIHTCTYVCV